MCFIVQAKWISEDVIAGLTMAVMLVPQVSIRNIHLFYVYYAIYVNFMSHYTCALAFGT